MINADFSQFKNIKVRDYAIRFLFGGAVSVLAQLITQWSTGRIGGIFTTFPAILLASLTIIAKKEGKEAAAADARGGIVGSIGLVIAAIVLSVTLELLIPALSLLLALVIWLACSIALYLLSFKAGWLRVKKQDQ
jgi:uncharacterized membrane protein (GlpM family)